MSGQALEIIAEVLVKEAAADTMARVLVPDRLRNAKIMLIGEAWGEQEELLGMPFIGVSGEELTLQLALAGIDRKLCYLTNVFNLRPANNDLDNLCCNKKDLPPGSKLIPLGTKWLRPEFISEIDRLFAEIDYVNPNIIITLGATPLYIVVNLRGIKKYRGTITESLTGHKVLPTYHPAHILRNWDLRTTSIADLIKARLESHFPDIRYPKREIWIEPTIKDIIDFEDMYMETGKHFATDVETARGQITCFSIATDPVHCIVVPFYDSRQSDNSYWSRDDEIWVRLWMQRVLKSQSPKIMQNGLYDTQYFLVEGIPVKRFDEDTMLMHHAMQPELPKGLGWLGSVYTNSPEWKSMRRKSNKREDE